MKPIILVPLVALVLAGGSAGAYLALTSEGIVEEAVVAQPTATPAPAVTAQLTPTPTPTPTPASTQPPGGGGGGGGGVLVPITTPLPTPPPVQKDWPMYTDPEGRLTVRYPPTWFERVGSLYSVDPSTRPDRGFPPNSIEVEIGYIDTAVSGGACGLLSIDPQSGELLFDEPEVAPATLGGVSGGQIVRVFDPPELGLTRIHAINVIHKGYCFQITAYFVQENPDEETFLQIASSFEFSE